MVIKYIYIHNNWQLNFDYELHYEHIHVVIFRKKISYANSNGLLKFEKWD
jgi:hypothetical protein